MATPITTLIASGIDAFSNLYDVRITLPGGDIKDAWSVRATNFSPPELTHGTYDVDYKIIQIKRPNALIEGDRKFTIEFRLDAGYQLYRDFTTWKNLWVDPTNGGSIQFGALSYAGATGSGMYGLVEVVAYKSSGASSGISTVQSSPVGAKWNFKDVICMKVGSPTLAREGADAATISADFIFGEYTLTFPAA
jgi:hypothetical protein